MKIKFPSSDGHVAELTLCGQGKDEGSFVGTVPMTLVPAVGVSIPTEKQVKVTSSTSTNRRGVRSGVIKVTLPYTAVMPDGNGGYVTDQSRSGAEMSVHMVVALPATTATDLRSADGVAKELAEQQIAAAVLLLASLLQGLVYSPIFDSTKVGDSSLVATGHPVAMADPDRSAIASIDGYEVQGGYGGITLTESGYQVNGGFQIAQKAFGRAAKNLIGRIARNLPALVGCDDVEVVGYHFVNSNE